jgi:hypothetical protein
MPPSDEANMPGGYPLGMCREVSIGRAGGGQPRHPPRPNDGGASEGLLPWRSRGAGIGLYQFHVNCFRCVREFVYLFKAGGLAP